MNIIKPTLIIGLIYISLQQKHNSTRNMMLIMTGLIGFCILSKVEGYCAVPTSLIADERDLDSLGLRPGKVLRDGIETPAYLIQDYIYIRLYQLLHIQLPLLPLQIYLTFLFLILLKFITKSYNGILKPTYKLPHGILAKALVSELFLK